MFNNINIAREDANGTEIEKMKVPLSYAAKDKLLARVKGDPEITKQAAITLPRMGFEITNIVYDSERKLNRIEKIVRRGDDPNHFKMVYTDAPYNILFNLYIYVKNAEDATKIVEQILPYFTPDFTVSAHIIPEMSITKDIPVVLNNIGIEDQYDGAFTQRQVLIYTLSFSMKAHLYGPILNKPVIKFVEKFIHVGNSQSIIEQLEIGERIASYPGLTANGDPTSNASETIDASLINFDDNYGEIIVLDVAPFTPNTYPFDR